MPDKPCASSTLYVLPRAKIDRGRSLEHINRRSHRRRALYPLPSPLHDIDSNKQPGSSDDDRQQDTKQGRRVLGDRRSDRTFGLCQSHRKNRKMCRCRPSGACHRPCVALRCPNVMLEKRQGQGRSRPRSMEIASCKTHRIGELDRYRCTGGAGHRELANTTTYA